MSKRIGVGAALLALGILAVGAGDGLGAGSTPITSATTKVLRAVNFVPGPGLAPPSPAQRIGDGNSPRVGPNEDVDNLSVNCSDSKSVTETALRATLPAGTHIYAGTLGSLRKKRKEVLLVRDPVDGNPYHCLLSNVTPKQFIAGTAWKN